MHLKKHAAVDCFPKLKASALGLKPVWAHMMSSSNVAPAAKEQHVISRQSLHLTISSIMFRFFFIWLVKPVRLLFSKTIFSAVKEVQEKNNRVQYGYTQFSFTADLMWTRWVATQPFHFVSPDRSNTTINQREYTAGLLIRLKVKLVLEKLNPYIEYFPYFHLKRHISLVMRLFAGLCFSVSA